MSVLDDTPDALQFLALQEGISHILHDSSAALDGGSGPDTGAELGRRIREAAEGGGVGGPPSGATERPGPPPAAAGLGQEEAWWLGPEAAGKGAGSQRASAVQVS